VVEYRTISKRRGWWQVVALIESWGRRSVCLYLWQERDNKWRRKQKFSIRTPEKWKKIQKAVEELISKL
jgi:hypothetical protein